MGIVKIIENKSDGRYKVEVQKDFKRAKQHKEKFEEDIKNLADLIAKTEPEFYPAQQAVINKADEVNYAIGLLNDRESLLESLVQSLKNANENKDRIEGLVSLKNSQKNNIEQDLQNQNLSQEDRAALQLQLNILNSEIEGLNGQLQTLANEISSLSNDIKEASNPAKIIKFAEELSAQLAELSFTRDKIRNEIIRHKFSKASKEKKLAELIAVIERKDEREIWATDYIDDLPVDAIVPSVDINDESNLILISPRTLVVNQEDLDQKQAAIDKVTIDSDAASQQLAQAFLDLEVIQGLVALKQKEVIEEGLVITTIPIDTSFSERDLIISESNKRLNRLRNELLDLTGQALIINSTKQKLADKKIKLDKKIAEMQSEKTQISTAINTQSGVYAPVVNQYTRSFQPTQSSTPEATYFNISLLPGVQKWRPTYRLGTITTITGDKCNLVLDEAISSQQKLNINQYETLSDVPIKYGDCHGSIFEVGDNVVIQYADRDRLSPVVIGFQDHPKQCGILRVIEKSQLDTSADTYYKTLDKRHRGVYYTNDNVAQYWYSSDKKEAINWGSEVIYLSGKAYQHNIGEVLTACVANNEQTELLDAITSSKNKYLIILIGSSQSVDRVVCAKINKSTSTITLVLFKALLISSVGIVNASFTKKSNKLFIVYRTPIQGNLQLSATKIAMISIAISNVISLSTSLIHTMFREVYQQKELSYGSNTYTFPSWYNGGTFSSNRSRGEFRPVTDDLGDVYDGGEVIDAGMGEDNYYFLYITHDNISSAYLNSVNDAQGQYDLEAGHASMTNNYTTSEQTSHEIKLMLASISVETGALNLTYKTIHSATNSRSLSSSFNGSGIYIFRNSQDIINVNSASYNSTSEDVVNDYFYSRLIPGSEAVAFYVLTDEITTSESAGLASSSTTTTANHKEILYLSTKHGKEMILSNPVISVTNSQTGDGIESLSRNASNFPVSSEEWIANPPVIWGDGTLEYKFVHVNLQGAENGNLFLCKLPIYSPDSPDVVSMVYRAFDVNNNATLASENYLLDSDGFKRLSKIYFTAGLG